MKLQNFRKLMVNRNNLNLEHNTTDFKITVGVIKRREDGLITDLVVVGEILSFGRTLDINETFNLADEEVRRNFQSLIEDYLQGDEDWM